MPRLAEKQVRDLLSITTAEDVEAFLNGIGAMSGSGWKWVPLGGRENNAGSVNLAVESGHALVERITNGLDAHIELQFEKAGRPAGLDSPRSAVTEFWKLDAGRLTRQSDQMAQFIDNMAPKTLVRVVGSKVRRGSAVVVEDSGIGQHPNDFSRTLLSLGESNKINKPYLMGAFGQGGSSTFAYCPYSTVFSRRHRDCLEGRADKIGWTIVRKYDDDSLKVFRYEYLVEENGGIPTLDPDYLDSIDLPFNSGTRFVHVAYDLGRLNAQWSLVGYRYFDNLLFDPVLPYRIEDRRFPRAINRNLYGARNRLDQVDASRRPEAQNYVADLAQWGGDGQIKIRYWVFRPVGDYASDPGDERGVKLDSYLDYDKSSRTIIFTLNGQRHHAQEKRIVRNRNLGALADYLLIHVDCDGMSRSLKKEIFTATRTGATSGEQREELLLKAVRDALSDHWLRQKMDEIVRRRQEQLTDESTRRVQRLLDTLISVYREEQRGGGQSGASQGGSSTTGEQDRKVHDPPQSLEFADHRLLEIQNGETKTIFLHTDGPDDLLSRPRKRARICVGCESDAVTKFSIGDIKDGRIPVHIRVPTDAPTGRRQQIEARLELKPATYLTDVREMRVIPPPEPYAGTDPPTEFRFARNTTMTVEVGRVARAEVHTNATNDVLVRAVNPASVKATCDIPGVQVAVRGPRDGVAYAEAHASLDAVPETEGDVKMALSFEDGTQFTTIRRCKIVEARKHAPSSGVQTAPIPAYQVLRVWRAAPADQPEALTWDKFSNPWNDAKIGTWEMNGEELHLLVNMDEQQFRSERIRQGKGTLGTSYMERLTDRHVAYLAFHLFQLHDQSQRTVENSKPDRDLTKDSENHATEFGLDYDPDSPVVAHELQRVAATLIQTLKSESYLMRLEAEAVTQD